MGTNNVSQSDQEYQLFLSIDGGGTKTKVTIVGKRRAGKESEIIGTGASESSNHTSVGVKSAVLSIGRATVEALRSIPSNRDDLKQASAWNFESDKMKLAPFEKIWAGLSGVDSPSDVQLMTLHLNHLFGFPSDDPTYSTRLRVTNDGDLLSAAIQIHYRSNKLSLTKPCGGGVVLIAGTGSIAVAFGPQTPNHSNLIVPEEDDVLVPLGRLGGYGYLLGDEGSAYYVGQQTIKEILKFNDIPHQDKTLHVSSTNISSHDHHHHLAQLSKMVHKSRLISLVLSHFNIVSLDQLVSTIYSIKNDQERKLKIAEISRLVMKSAFSSSELESNPTQPNHTSGSVDQEEEQGDEFSKMILTRSAERLSELVSDLCHLYHLNPREMVLCLGGGMWTTYPQFQQLVLSVMLQKWNASWGWIQTINRPDQLAALSLP